jgi:hypothetical protein
MIKREQKTICDCMSKDNFGNHTIKSPYVGHLYYGNDNTDVDLKYLQAIDHIICYNSLILVSIPKIQARTCLILYNIITNNCIEKTCVCRPFCQSQSVWRGSEWSFENITRKTTSK